MKLTSIIFVIISIFAFTNCNNCMDKKSGNNTLGTMENRKSADFCSDNCKAINNSTDISCKLTSAEMQKRKAKVLESLRKQILDKKELPDGYAFKFSGSDQVLDELTAFIKSERECCDFFTFNLSIGGDKKEIWLQLTGAKEAKEFIRTELEL
jgi:hypothetical protein